MVIICSISTRCKTTPRCTRRGGIGLPMGFFGSRVLKSLPFLAEGARHAHEPPKRTPPELRGSLLPSSGSPPSGGVQSGDPTLP
jgi:hypothetical protein